MVSLTLSAAMLATTLQKLRVAPGSLAPAPRFRLLDQARLVTSSRGRGRSLKVQNLATSHSTPLVLSTWALGRVGKVTCPYDIIPVNVNFYDYLKSGKFETSFVQDQSLVEQPVAGGED